MAGEAATAEGSAITLVCYMVGGTR